MSNSLKFEIDNITWNDLNMDAVFEQMNTASSSVGTEYLKRTLKTLEFDEETLKIRDKKINTFNNEPQIANNLKKIYKNLGKTKKVSFLDYIFKLNEIKPQSNLKHFALIILLLFSIALIFIKPAIGIIALVVMIAVNIIFYFRFKAPIEPYFNCIKYLVSMIIAGEKISKELKPKQDEFDLDINNLNNLVKIFGSIKRGSFLITNSVAGSIVDVIMDYVRMLFHVDLIKFNSMHKKCAEHNEEISLLYNILGEIETCICISEYRNKIDYYCCPEFNRNTIEVDVIDCFHPLVKKPVPNSIKANKSVLLTGSNASGKSTFLKMIAINQIFAQTIYTCLAKSYKTNFYKVISSMALNDNILGEESYFIVEIKSLKRIFDSLSEKVPVMAFVDEVLRGTNTKERIAASSQILKNLSHENALCFAATHDIELTELLKSDMDNYHFSESVSDNSNDVSFDYKLREGYATSHNAIKLLKAYDFPKEIVENALKMTEESN